MAVYLGDKKITRNGSASSALTEAKAYTDAREVVITNAYEEADSEVIAEVENYTDAKVQGIETGVAQAQSTADEALALAQSIDLTEYAKKSYVDEAVEDVVRSDSATRIWTGTEAEYTALGSYDEGTLYIIM